MTGPEIKQQIEQAADSFKDDKIDQTEAKKIADTLDTNKVKSEDVQDFIEHSPTYSSVIDGLITNIEKYTKPDAFIGPILPGEKKLQIVENKVPLQSLTQTEKEKIISDATKFLIRMKEEKANFDKKKNSLPVTPPVKEIINTTPASAEVKYDSQKPLESMLLAINDNLIQAKVEDKTLIQTPEQIHTNAEKIRNNLKDGIMKQVEVELKNLLKIKDKKIDNEYDNKKEAIYKFLYESFDKELKKGKRIENLVVGGLYVTINGIKQKMDAPSKEKLKDFNLVGANILSNVKDINTLLSANGNVMDNLFKNSQDKIVKKIKATFPREAITKMTEQDVKAELGNIKQNGFYINLGMATNPVTEVFSKDITIDSELAAIQFIESNNGLPKTTKEQLGGESGAEVQKDLTKKLKDILGEVPTTPHEKEAFKTELIQNKFSGWSKSLLETIYNLAQKRGFGDLLNMFNKDGLFDKVLLSKSRNDALIAKKLYIDSKKEGNKLVANGAPEDLQKIMTSVDMGSTFKALNDCKKFISPVVNDGGKETDDKDRAKKFMTEGGEYDKTKVDTEFSKYVQLLGIDRKNKISRPIEKDKVKTEKIYSFKDLIKDDNDLVEHFMQYVQTGQLPNGYADKKIYENMKDLGISPEEYAKKQTHTKEEIVAPITPAGVEKTVIEKSREKDAATFANSVKGNAFQSKLWTDSYAVEYKLNGKKTVKMFKGPNAKKI